MIVRGGGFTLRTEDPIMIAVVRRCADLDEMLAAARQEIADLRHQETARYRTLRRDVRAIRKHLERTP